MDLKDINEASLVAAVARVTEDQIDRVRKACVAIKALPLAAHDILKNAVVVKTGAFDVPPLPDKTLAAWLTWAGLNVYGGFGKDVQSANHAQFGYGDSTGVRDWEARKATAKVEPGRRYAVYLFVVPIARDDK